MANDTKPGRQNAGAAQPPHPPGAGDVVKFPIQRPRELLASVTETIRVYRAENATISRSSEQFVGEIAEYLGLASGRVEASPIHAPLAEPGGGSFYQIYLQIWQVTFRVVFKYDPYKRELHIRSIADDFGPGDGPGGGDQSLPPPTPPDATNNDLALRPSRPNGRHAVRHNVAVHRIAIAGFVPLVGLVAVWTTAAAAAVLTVAWLAIAPGDFSRARGWVARLTGVTVMVPSPPPPKYNGPFAHVTPSAGRDWWARAAKGNAIHFDDLMTTGLPPAYLELDVAPIQTPSLRKSTRALAHPASQPAMLVAVTPAVSFTQDDTHADSQGTALGPVIPGAITVAASSVQDHPSGLIGKIEKVGAFFGDMIGLGDDGNSDPSHDGNTGYHSASDQLTGAQVPREVKDLRANIERPMPVHHHRHGQGQLLPHAFNDDTATFPDHR